MRFLLNRDDLLIYKQSKIKHKTTKIVQICYLLLLVSIIFENIFYSFFLSTSLCNNRELCNFKKLVCPSNVILEKSMIVEVAVSICLLTFLHLENLSEKRCMLLASKLPLEKLTTTTCILL